MTDGLLADLASQFWLQKLGWTLLHFLWQGTAIVVIYAIVRRAMGSSLSAQGRYALACTALMAMTIAPALTFLFIREEGNLPAIPWNIAEPVWQRLLPCFVALWLAGVLVFSIRLFGGWRLTTRLRLEACAAAPEWQRTLEGIAARVRTSRKVRLLTSSQVAVPTVMGWLRPVILVPLSALTGLPTEHITALLAHELAHIRRHDYIANILQSVAEAVLFYHPAVWWISGQIRTERELCCDDIAVAASDDALTYASALAQLESIQPSRLRTVLAANGGSLLNRVRRLIEPAQTVVDELPGPGAAWTMALLLLTGIGVATVHAAQKPAAPPQVVGNPEYPIPATIAAYDRPSPFGALASHARNSLLFDPFLSAQLARSQVRDDGNGTADAAPRFELAAVRTSPRPAARMTGGFYGGARFDVQSAEMLDLIRIAYGVEADKVVGGPNWLEWNRYDVLAKAPEHSTPATMRLMLRTLLAERFQLVVRDEARELPTYALTAGHKTELRPASGAGDSGCKLDFRKSPTDGPGAYQTLTYTYTCRNATMATLAEQITPLIGSTPVADETRLDGAWDFSFRFSFQAATRVAALMEALEKQVGLKLEPRTLPSPVLAVESVNAKPAADAPGVMEKLLAATPKEFEVADIRPSDPNSPAGNRGPFQPGGRVTMRGVTLQYLIWFAWNATLPEIVGEPKFADTDRFDLIAKAPADATSDSTIGEPSVDTSALRIMVRTLLVNRFKLATHTEERPVAAYTLTAMKPKLSAADPANRTAFHERAGAGGKDPRAGNPLLGRLVTCQNMTMSQFAENLPVIAGGYFGDVSRNVLDATGMDGAYDFTFAFSEAGALRNSGRGGTDSLATGGSGVGQAPDPDSGVSLFEALEKQLGLKLEREKRSLPVLVIDHIEQKPTDD